MSKTCHGCDKPATHEISGISAQWCGRCYETMLATDIEVLLEHGAMMRTLTAIRSTKRDTIGRLVRCDAAALEEIKNIGPVQVAKISRALRLFWEGATPADEIDEGRADLRKVTKSGVEQRKAEIKAKQRAGNVAHSVRQYRGSITNRPTGKTPSVPKSSNIRVYSVRLESM